MRIIAAKLAEVIGYEGSVIVWNAQFETVVTTKWLSTYPNLPTFCEGLISVCSILMEIFRQHHYVHPAFRGSCSIKDVLPVNRANTVVQGLSDPEGGTASLTWYRLLTDSSEAAERHQVCKTFPITAS